MGGGGGGEDGYGDFFAFFELRGDGRRLGVGRLGGGGDDEGEVRDSVVVVGGEKVVEVGGEEVNSGSVYFGVGFKPIQNGDVDEDVFAPVDCSFDSVLEDVLERGKAGDEDLVVEIVRV